MFFLVYSLIEVENFAPGVYRGQSMVLSIRMPRHYTVCSMPVFRSYAWKEGMEKMRRSLVMMVAATTCRLGYNSSLDE